MSKIKGIDVSAWQGNINWKKVKEDGIKFVILREGYRKSIDSRFLEYVKGAKENDIEMMVYHFIYTDGATIKENASATVNNMKKAGLDISKTWIFADLEYDTWNCNGEKVTRSKCTKYTLDYLKELERLGCKKLGIYTNIDYYRNYYDWSQLKGYKIWLADYYGEPDYDCMLQQYTSSGKVSGISGNVDMNYCYENITTTNPSTPTKGTKTVTELAKEVLAGKWGNGEDRKEKLTKAGYDYAKVQAKVNELSKTTPTKPTKQTKPTTVKKTTASYPAGRFDNKLAGTYKTTDNLYCRDGAGSTYSALCLIPKGTEVKNFGYYTNSNGTKWLYIQFTLKGVLYTGFSSSNYLKRI